MASFTLLFLSSTLLQLHYILTHRSLTMFQRQIILLGSLILSVASTLHASLFGPWVTVLWTVCTLALLVNAVRFLNPRYKNTSVVRRYMSVFMPTVAMQFLVVFLLYFSTLYAVPINFIDTLRLFGLLLSFVMAGMMVRSAVIYRARRGRAKGQLPTVSLLIPARNEDPVLEQMLRNVLQSDYPKLEIIVLDDCSHDRTPAIIRDFAHDGVRFYGGNVRPDGWLGKNWALHQLIEQASGDVLMFCDVDVRLSPHSISTMVNQMSVTKSSMVSVMPQRLAFDFWANLLQPLTDFWQLVLPSKLTKTAPVIGSCWAIKASLTKKLTMSELKQQITPEHWYARIAKAGKGYHFVLGNADIGVSRRKRLNSQEDTMNRKYYPWLQRSPFLVFVVAPVVTIALLLPWVDLVFSHAYLVSLFAVLLQLFAVLLFITKHNPASWFLVLFQLPLLYLHELYRAVYSCWAYEFGEIDWKQRNVCEPMLEVIEHLPPLASK